MWWLLACVFPSSNDTASSRPDVDLRIDTDPTIGCPAIQSDRSGMDWPSADLGSQLSVIVHLENPCGGGEDLSLQARWDQNDDRVFRAVVGAEAIPPGESASLTVTFVHPEEPGAWTGVLVLETNDAATPELPLTFTAQTAP